MRRRIFLFLFLFILLGGSVMGWFGYRMVLSSNFQGESIEFFVYDTTSVEDVVLELGSGLIDPETFIEWASMRDLQDYMKKGRYTFEEGMSNRVMVNRLKGGIQTPTRVQFQNIGNLEELAEALAEDLSYNKSDFLAALNNDSIWQSFGVGTGEIRRAYFIPNTYEVYWTETPESVVARLIREREKFWNKNRRAKAESAGLSLMEVSILASMVQGETYMIDEMDTVAGLYINRLNKGIPMQCDATSKYAWEVTHPEDIPVRRVTYEIRDFIHPYNTNVIDGLPPAPISIPEYHTLEAVLNHVDHDYLFMMADPDRVGYHRFAKTVREHDRNVKYYRQVRDSRR